MGLFDIFKKKEEQKQQVQPSPAVKNNEPEEVNREIVLKSNSLVCDAEAFVEKYDDCYYFYIFFPFSKEQKVKNCWICNRKKAPDKINLDDMSNGKGPMMPAEFVTHDINGIELDEKNLSIVWFEEGESAALLCGEDILAVIPGWSGYKNFHGYAKYAKGTGPFAWELTGALNAMKERVKSGKKLWANANPHDMKMWMLIQHDHAKKFLVNHEVDYNIAHKADFKIGENTFPMKVVAQGTRNGVVYGLTAGVSLVAMPMVDFHVEGDPKDTRRMELGFAAEEKFRQICHPMYANLSMYAKIPWQQITFLAHGHTVPFYNIKGFAAVLFVNPRFVEGLESPEYYPYFDGGIVNLLWTVLITQEEYDFAVKNSSEELLKKAKDMSRIHIFDGSSKFNL